MSEIVKLQSKNIKLDMIRALEKEEIDGLVLVFRKGDELGIMIGDKLGNDEEKNSIGSVFINFVLFLLRR